MQSVDIVKKNKDDYIDIDYTVEDHLKNLEKKNNHSPML